MIKFLYFYLCGGKHTGSCNPECTDLYQKCFLVAKNNVFDYQNFDHRMQIGHLNTYTKSDHKTQNLPPESGCLLLLPI